MRSISPKDGVRSRKPFPARPWKSLTANDLCQFIGYCCNVIWIWMVFWAPTFIDSFLKIDTSQGSPYQLSLIVNTVSFGALFIICRFVNPLHRLAGVPLCSAVSMTAGCILLIANLHGASNDYVVHIISSLLTGSGSAVLVVLWGENLSRSKTNLALRCCIAASITSGIVIAFLTWALPQLYTQAIVLALPFASIALLAVSNRCFDLTKIVPVDSRPSMRIPVRIAFISLFFGCCFGLVRGLCSSDTLLEYEPDVFYLNMFAFAASGVIAFFATSILKLDFRRLTYQIALPLMALGFVFLSIKGMQAYAMPIHNLGFHYFYIILWTLWAHLGGRDDTPSSWLFACGMFFLQVGQLAGSFIGSAFSSSFPASIEVLSLFLLFGMLLVALYFSESKDFKVGFGLVKPGIEGQRISVFDQADLQLRCAEVGQGHDLSKREIEVLILLVQGYNRPQICETLVIGDETVKTHIKHIYQKLSVHTRKDLVRFVADDREG